MTIETKFNIDDIGYVLVKDVIYPMIIEKCEISFTNNKEYYEQYTLIHSKANYENKKVFYAKDVHKTVDELREYEISKAKSYILSSNR